MSSPTKLPLRIASLSFAVVVTGFLVARAAGCTSAKIEPVSPTSAPPPVAPTTPSDPGKPGAPPFPAPSETPGDAGPQAELMNVNSPAFLPASKAAMPIMHPPEKNPAPAPAPAQQAATP
jgi:hypothetical protein